MATITSATSGLASATSTWVGGVVPGTTFAGTRTTTGAAVALGAVSIPVSSGAQVVTAGKRIKVAGDPNTYRVATGVAGGSAGNIIIDAPGLLVAIPASATTVSVDMVDDKVIIAHPGTNNATSTLYRLNGARAAGDTSIPVDTGSGSIVAGECVQVLHQLGTDEDGQPYYDNTYYKVTTGITGAGTLVIAAPGLTYAVADNVQIINRGHVVELDGVCSWGDDTSSTTPTSSGIALSGSIKASRSVSSKVILRGTLAWAVGGTLDLGLPVGDPLPAGVLCNVVVNDSATLSAGKHGLFSGSQNGATLRIAGAKRTRNTRLTTSVSANANSITVDDSLNWGVGDTLVLASDTYDATRAQVLTISGGSSPNFTVSPNVTIARAAGCRIGNFTSGVTFAPQSSAAPSFVSFSLATNLASSLRASDFTVREMGTSGGWPTSNNVGTRNAFYVAVQGLVSPVYVRRIALFTQTAYNQAAVEFSSVNTHKFVDAACYSSVASGAGFQLASGASWDMDAVVYRHVTPFLSANSDGSAGCVLRGDWWATSQGFMHTPSVDTTIVGAKINGYPQILNSGNGKVTLNGCTVDGGRLVAYQTGVSAVVTYNTCTFLGITLTDSITVGAAPKQSSAINIIAANGDLGDNRVRSYWQETVTDLTTRKRSAYAVKIQPKVANTAITYPFTLPAVAGVQQTIKGSLRFDSTYGTATPPRIDLSGQGVTQSKTCAAVADAWDDFTFTFTPTGTGDITATVTVQSASTAGFAWLDGIYHYPMTQSVRHYGYQFLAQAALIANDKLTVTDEATVLAYPVTVDHGTGAITITDNATATQIGDYLEADLCQTANQAQAVHYTLGVGGAFTTSYEVLIGSGVAITGAYTDALGLHVAVEATLPTTGCQIQLYDVTADVELDNREASGTAYSYPITYDTYTAGHTLRLRVAQAGSSAAKLPQEVFAALTTGGAVFTVPDEDDTVYASNGIDGSTCDASGGGEFTADYPNLQIDVSDVDGMTSVRRVYAWSAWANTTTLGIRLMFGAVEALDTLNYVIHQDVVDAKFDNVNATPVLIAGGYIRRADGTTVIAATSNSIQMDPGRAYVAPSIESDVAAIKAKTDNLPADPADASDIAASFSAAAVTAAAIKAKTDNLPAAPAAVGDIPTAAQNADKLLGRTLAGAADGGRTVKDALRASRNKSQLVGSTLTVYQEDDATPAWTADVTTASRDPVSGIDPA